MSEVGEREHRPWLWALVSTACLLAGLGLAVSWPATDANADRYERAVAEGIAEERAATVADTRRVRRLKKHDKFFLDLRYPGGRIEQGIELESSDDWETFSRGDEVRAVLWDGKVARIERPQRAPVETTESPVHDRAVYAIYAVLVVPWSTFGLVTAFRMRKRSRSWFRKAALPRGRFTRNRSMGCGAVMLSSIAATVAALSAVYDLWIVAVVTQAGAVVGALAGFGIWSITLLRHHVGGDDKDDEDEDGEQEEDDEEGEAR